jgi:glycosyltransferase involved in cell wall biosynthesis
VLFRSMVTHAFPRWEGDVAGAFILRLAQALDGRGNAVRVIAPADRGDAGPDTVGGVAVRRVRYASPERETLAYRGTMHTASARSPAAALAFAGLLRAFLVAVEEACAGGHADVVHAHWWVPGGVAAALARRRGRPLVITLHGTDVALARSVPGARYLFRAVARNAAGVNAVSSALARHAAAAAGLPLESIAIAPMPLLLQPTPPAPERHGALFVGRLAAQKRVGVLLDALGLLASRGLPMDLAVVGDGPERGALEARAAQPDLAGRVRFTGEVPPEDVRRHLSAARLLVLPSVDEGLGLVIAEALVSGVPVVGARSGGIPDLVTAPYSGLLVPPDDVAALADAIAEVVTDDRYLSGAKRAGVALAERLAPATAAEQFEGLYTQALRGTGR